MQKRWNILQADPARVAALQAELANVHPTLCEILVNRGVGNFAQAKAFFMPRRGANPTPCLKCRFGAGSFDYIMAGPMPAGDLARTIERSDA